MEVLRSPSSSGTPRKGCNPILTTQRSKMQSQRSIINQKMRKQMRIRAGAENLFNATTNAKVKETVALELSFVNSNLQLLKEELSEINSSVEHYQNKSGKTVCIPLLPLGLKDTQELEFSTAFENFVSEHYWEDPIDHCDEIADFADMRTSIRTPARTYEGVSLMLEYYNQLYFVENRFFSPTKPLGVFFHWYDSITGVPSVQRSVSLEKASILFNIGALYSQIGTRADRTRKAGVDTAIGSFERSAGVYNYLRNNFTNSPTPDLSHAFLSALTFLMLAQAQECELERKVLGGFEIELGKCASIAQEAIKVADQYKLADKAFNIDSMKSYVPSSWVNMVQVKSHHYRALAHYYAALGLLDQHEAAEPLEISKLLSTLYLDEDDKQIPKPDAAARRKEDRRRLGKSHLRQAVFFHERALQTHSLCKIMRSIDILKEYLQHAHNRSVTKFAEVDTEEDFFELVEAPKILPHTDHECTAIPPAFGSVTTTDIFKRLGPLTVFSSNCQLDPPKQIILTNQEASCGFSLQGSSPVTITSVDDKAWELGMRKDDVIVAVDGVDVKWSNHEEVANLIAKCRGAPVTLKLISVRVIINPQNTRITEMHSYVNGMALKGNNNNNSNNVVMFADDNDTVVRRKPRHERNREIKKRHSFGIFQGLKLRTKHNHFATISEKPVKERPSVKPKSAVTLQRSSTTRDSFHRAGGTMLRKRRDLSSDIRSDC